MLRGKANRAMPGDHMRKLQRFFIVLLGVLTATGCATHSATSGRVVIKDDRGVVDIRFSDHDRELIHSYYSRGHGRGLPPGLAKRQQLPPGLAKRDRLPPGLDGQSLPADLDQQLSRLPTGYARVRIGRDIVLKDTRTRVILDIIYNIPD